MSVCVFACLYLKEEKKERETVGIIYTCYDLSSHYLGVIGISSEGRSESCASKTMIFRDTKLSDTHNL